jgi:trehalose 6-phosphate phosphatase
VSEPHLGSGLRHALARLATTPRLLVALDFDGTLAPFVQNSVESRMLPRARAAIDVLDALPDTWVAYISGRTLKGLAHVTYSGADALLVASHGVEVRLGAAGRKGSEARKQHGVQLGADERERLETLAERLREVVERSPGARLERKPAGLGLHTRGMQPDRAALVWQQGYEAARGLGEFHVREGKKVLEFAIRGETKGDGVDLLRAHVDATGVLFAGDDATDEDGFAALRPGDVGIKVGEGATAAEFRVADPAATAAALAALAAARSAR